MKTIIKLISVLIFFHFLLTQSCNKQCDCPEPQPDMISQYNLDKSIVEVNTTNVSTGLETFFSDIITDSSQRANFSQIFVDAARFYDDKSGYFFIETLNDAWVVAHINHDLIGTSRIEIQDENGKLFIKEMVETVKYSGYGFVEYYRKNPSTNLDERKMSFVTSIKSADWFIGTGFYGGTSNTYYEYTEAQKLVLKETSRTMANAFSGIFDNLFFNETERVSFCRNFMDHIRFFDDGSGYFFINDLNGINIAHGASPVLQGQNVNDLQDTKGAYIIKDMAEIVINSGSGFYEYYWNNPATGKEEQKISYVIKIPGSQYYIGAGFYVKN